MQEEKGKKKVELSELQNMSVEDIFKNAASKTMKFQCMNVPHTLKSP